MLNRKALCIGEQPDEAAVLDVERLLLGNKELRLVRGCFGVSLVC